MRKMIPLISSGNKGPLGVLHLPRLWQKVSLEAAGKLADGYPGIGAGYDSMVIAGYDHDADTKASILAATGLSEGPDDAINLNNLDDWQEFHAAEIAG